MCSPPIDFDVCHTFKHPKNPSRGSFQLGEPQLLAANTAPLAAKTLSGSPPPPPPPPPPPTSCKTAALHLCATHLYNILQSSPIRTDGLTTFTHCDAYSDDDWPLPKLSPIKSWCTYARRFTRRVAGEVF